MALLDDLISVWDFEEATGTDNAGDSHGSNHLAQNNNATSVAGKLGNARQIDVGGNDYFEIQSGLITSLPASVSIWFKPSSNDGNIVTGGIGGSNNFAWGLSLSPADKLQFYASDGSANFTDITGTTTLTVDGSTWYHAFFAWRSATDYELYLNGASEGSSSTNRSPSGSADRFVLGKYAPSGVVDLDFVVDQTAIWSADKTSDLASLYNGGSGLAYASWTAGGGGGGSMLLLVEE
jgi:hypothetical protein